MDYAPPPLFKQGTPARIRIIIYVVVAIIMLMVDSRLQSLVQVRQAIGFVLYPLQKAALWPRDALYGVGDYFTSVNTLQDEVDIYKKQELENSQLLQQAQHLATENAHLRELLKLSERVTTQSITAEILYDARVAYSRKVIINRGTSDGVALGRPVIDEYGIVGQITRVFVSTAEVTLIVDKSYAIPVQVARTGLRGVAYGRGQSAQLELRFMEANADIQAGDMLVTSGIDGLYPPGLAVGQVLAEDGKVMRSSNNNILCNPVSGFNKNRQVLVLLSEIKMPPRPPDEDEDIKSKKKLSAARRKAGTK